MRIIRPAYVALHRRRTIPPEDEDDVPAPWLGWMETPEPRHRADDTDAPTEADRELAWRDRNDNR